MTNCPHRDRAATIATALIQIIRSVPEIGLRQPIENYLRDELADVERQIAAERSCPDA
jgi:hypothetical protein